MHTAEFLLALIAIFVAAKGCGEIAERFRQPAVLGELIGGIVIGVSGLRLVNPHDVTIHLLAELGVILLLFVIGLETDLHRLVAVGGSAAAVAIVGVVLPFAGGYAFGQFLGMTTIVSIFLGASMTATSVGISARVLSDLGHLQDREAQVILGAAVLDDILGLILLTLVGTLALGGELTALGIGRVVVVAFGFVALAIVIGSRLAPILVRLITRAKLQRALFFSAVIFAMGLAWLAHQAGSAMIIGAFAAGLVLARTNGRKEILPQVHDVAQFFIPIFFVVVGASIDLGSINPFEPDSRRFLLLGLALTAIGIAGKVAAGFAVRGKLNRLVIGVGMIPRGEVGLIFAQIGLSRKLISSGTFSAVALMVMLTTLITPLLLRRLLAQRAPTAFAGHAAEYVGLAPMDREHPEE